MSSSRLISWVFVAAALSVGCSSSNDKSDTSGPAKDSGTAKDSSTTTDSATSPTDSAVEDTYVPPTDTATTPTDAPGDTASTTCDKWKPRPDDECNMIKQDCADPTATCTFDSGKNHAVCAKLTIGTATKGESCASQGDCDRGLFCYSGKCTPACCPGDNSLCGAGGQCNLSITDASDAVIHYACTYPAGCHAFKYDCPADEVCLFSEEPDAFKCSSPTGAIGTAPGTACKYANDCGESQVCTALTSGDAGAGASQCYLFCWLSKPSGWTPGTTPGGRFPADGTCTIGGKKYGTCTSIGGIGGGLGLCVP